jgi:hypothetical protein
MNDLTFFATTLPPLDDDTRFSMRDLSTVNYANGWTLWHLKGPSLAAVLSDNWLRECADMLVPGDHIHASTRDGGNAVLAVETVAPGRVVVRRMMS